MPYKSRQRQREFQQAWHVKNGEVSRARTRRRAKEVRDYAVNYKKTHPCVDCGEDDWVVLDFDHRPGSHKRFGISNYKYLTMRRLIEEIAKCEIRCANCHRRITYARSHLKKNAL